MQEIKILNFGRAENPLFSFLKFLAQRKKQNWIFQSHDIFSYEALQGAVAALVDVNDSEEILRSFPVTPRQVQSVGALDSLFYEGGRWMPRLLIHDNLKDVIVSEVRDLDSRSPAFIVGESVLIKGIAASLAEMGFADIYLVGDGSELDRHAQVLSRSQLGIRFQVLSARELTMQAISAGIVVNIADFAENPDLLIDLSYFNFMKQSGVVLDLNLITAENPLLDEALKAQLRVIPYFAYFRLWIKNFLVRTRCDQILEGEDLVQLWDEFLRQNPSSV